MPRRFEGDRGITGERLWALRREAKISTAELSRRTGINATTISYLEVGRVREPEAFTLCILADFYGVSMDYLYGRTDNRRMAQ